MADSHGKSFAYDARGWRVMEQQGNASPVYSVYDQNHRLVLRWSQPTGETDFVSLGGTTVARVNGFNTTWIQPDEQGSPLLETNIAMAVTRQPIYLGYGRTDNDGRREIPGYTGAAMNAATGHTYLGARYLYHDRFLSPDPAQLDQTTPFGLNRYAYANDNPVRFTDPDGRFAQALWGAPIGAIVDIVDQKVANPGNPINW